MLDGKLFRLYQEEVQVKPATAADITLIKEEEKPGEEEGSQIL